MIERIFESVLLILYYEKEKQVQKNTYKIRIRKGYVLQWKQKRETD